MKNSSHHSSLQPSADPSDTGRQSLATEPELPQSLGQKSELSQNVRPLHGAPALLPVAQPTLVALLIPTFGALIPAVTVASLVAVLPTPVHTAPAGFPDQLANRNVSFQLDPRHITLLSNLSAGLQGRTPGQMLLQPGRRRGAKLLRSLRFS